MRDEQVQPLVDLADVLQLQTPPADAGGDEWAEDRRVAATADEWHVAVGDDEGFPGMIDVHDAVGRGVFGVAPSVPYKAMLERAEFVARASRRWAAALDALATAEAKMAAVTAERDRLADLIRTAAAEAWPASSAEERAGRSSEQLVEALLADLILFRESSLRLSDAMESQRVRHVAERDRLSEIVAKLPTTADGVSVTLKMILFQVLEYDETHWSEPRELRPITGFSVDHRNRLNGIHFERGWWRIADCKLFASRKAALAFRKSMEAR